jgi:hypothetical protein
VNKANLDRRDANPEVRAVAIIWVIDFIPVLMPLAVRTNHFAKFVLSGERPAIFVPFMRR